MSTLANETDMNIRNLTRAAQICLQMCRLDIEGDIKFSFRKACWEAVVQGKQFSSETPDTFFNDVLREIIDISISNETTKTSDGDLASMYDIYFELMRSESIERSETPGIISVHIHTPHRTLDLGNFTPEEYVSNLEINIKKLKAFMIIRRMSGENDDFDNVKIRVGNFFNSVRFGELSWALAEPDITKAFKQIANYTYSPKQIPPTFECGPDCDVGCM